MCTWDGLSDGGHSSILLNKCEGSQTKDHLLTYIQCYLMLHVCDNKSLLPCDVRFDCFSNSILEMFVLETDRVLVVLITEISR